MRVVFQRPRVRRTGQSERENAHANTVATALVFGVPAHQDAGNCPLYVTLCGHPGPSCRTVSAPYCSPLPSRTIAVRSAPEMSSSVSPRLEGPARSGLGALTLRRGPWLDWWQGGGSGPATSRSASALLARRCRMRLLRGGVAGITWRAIWLRKDR